LAERLAKNLIRTSANSISRIANQRAEVGAAASTSYVKRALDDLTNPPSLGGGMRKAGIALIAAPDPFTGVPGVALLAASFVAKRNEPATLRELANETRRVLRDFQSIGL